MYITGERQKKLSEALDKAPPKAYLEAMAALLKWLQNNKDVLKSEKYEVKELAVMEKQYRQFKVGSLNKLLCFSTLTMRTNTHCKTCIS